MKKLRAPQRFRPPTGNTGAWEAMAILGELLQTTERPCIRFARINAADASEVASFILWLFQGDLGCPPDPSKVDSREPNEDATGGRVDPGQMIELEWGWDAPRQRMAKLLWCSLQGTTDEDHFRQTFSANPWWLEQDAQHCWEVLLPIQEKLRWVLEGFMQRVEQDRPVGQQLTGEEWWLPPEQAAFVRAVLHRTTPDLIEQPSDYEAFLKWSASYVRRSIVQAMDVASEDPDRVYVGTREHSEMGGFAARVLIEA